MKHVLCEYVNFSNEGYDLGSLENPLGTAVNVVAITDEDGARRWLSNRTSNAGIFPLRALSQAAKAKVYRACKRATR